MNLPTLLEHKKKTIVAKWIDLLLDSYGSPDFFKKQKNRFANPIGTTISENLQILYDVLVGGGELGEAAGPLENIMKIRAVQDFSPSQSVFFVFLLKNIVQEELAREKNRGEILAGLADFYARIDKVALMAFDFYMDCRERLHQIRIKEVLSGRSAVADGVQCVSAMLKRNEKEAPDKKQINRLT